MKITECPRDAMQGIHTFIPTAEKVRYLNQLLAVGFDTVDFGSFVSPKAVPQMRDTADVLQQLDTIGSSRLLAIIANVRGAEMACSFDRITYLGFPLSLSETFQQRNTNKSIAEAFIELDQIQERCSRAGKILVTYLSMGFGNPYGDPYDESLVEAFTARLRKMGVTIVSLADTVGLSTPEQIRPLVKKIVAVFPDLEIGVHLHARRDNAGAKIQAAFDAGCHRLDGAIHGYGGCPMAGDALVGNIATEDILRFLGTRKVSLGIDEEAFQKASAIAAEIFPDR